MCHLPARGTCSASLFAAAAATLAGGRLRPTRRGHRLGEQRLLQLSQHLGALPFDHGHEAAEVEPCEPDAAGRADDAESEVLEEVRGEDRLVDAEALVGRLTLGVAVRERLDRGRTAVAALADR